MTTEIKERLEQISQLAEVNLDELSLGITQESRLLANLSEERRQAIQELLGFMGYNHGEETRDEGNLQRTVEKVLSPSQLTESDGTAQEESEPDALHPDWLTVDQVSTILRVKPWTVRRWIRSGLISHVVLPGGAYRIGEADLEFFISAHYQRATQDQADIQDASVGI